MVFFGLLMGSYLCLSLQTRLGVECCLVFCTVCRRSPSGEGELVFPVSTCVDWALEVVL